MVAAGELCCLLWQIWLCTRIELSEHIVLSCLSVGFFLDTWFRPPFWDLLMLQLLRPNSSNLPCLYSTYHLEYPLVLSRFYFVCLSFLNYILHYTFKSLEIETSYWACILHLCMHIPIMMPYQMTPRPMTLWLWLWPVCLNNFFNFLLLMGHNISQTHLVYVR